MPAMHDEASILYDRGLVLDAGAVLQEDSPNEIVQRLERGAAEIVGSEDLWDGAEATRALAAPAYPTATKRLPAITTCGSSQFAFSRHAARPAYFQSTNLTV
jgi:hypothetical protein